jgi:hypothetical protein
MLRYKYIVYLVTLDCYENKKDKLNDTCRNYGEEGEVTTVTKVTEMNNLQM